MSYKDWLEKKYYAYRGFVPGRLLYHPDHFYVKKILAADTAVRQCSADARLRHILNTAVQWVPFYRDQIKLSPQFMLNEAATDILSCFPYLEKAEIMARQRDFLDVRLNPDSLNYATSGGSTGQGIGLWRTKRLADIEKAFFAFEWSKLGFSLDKSRFLRIGADARRLAHESPTTIVGNRLMLSPYHISARSKKEIVAELNKFKPDFIHAYPSSAAGLAELINGVELQFKVKAVLLASEPATNAQLNIISKVFDCPISVNYGLTERTNIAFANYRDGVSSPYKFESLYGFSENRGPDNEIVGTSLWNDVMPLIRYCTKDFGLINKNGDCESLNGRDQEFLVDRFGNRIPGLSIVIDEVTWDFIQFYQIQQKRAGHIVIAVVPRNGVLTLENAKFVLDAQIKRWGSFFDISLEEVIDIPLSANGKRRLVVSEREPT
jgi:phenylacetate-CoA ligase